MFSNNQVYSIYKKVIYEDFRIKIQSSPNLWTDDS